MLLDTSGLFCCMHARDSRHRVAWELLMSASSAITHGYIAAELIALGSARNLARRTIFDFLASLEATPGIEMVYVDRLLHADAMFLLRHREDKRWSLCDAVSFVLMQQREIHEALTTDRHFEQAGYARLLSD